MISRTEMLISSQITLFSPPTSFREVTLRYLFCHHREDLSGRSTHYGGITIIFWVTVSSIHKYPALRVHSTGSHGEFINFWTSFAPIFHASKRLIVKGPVILSYAVGCLLMTQACLSLTEYISFCGLTIKIAGSMCVFWSCNLFFFVVFIFACTCRAQIK